MGFDVEPPRPQRRALWLYLLGGALVAALLFLAFWKPARQAPRPAQVEKPLPFGPAEQKYAASVKFENLKMSRFENMFKQQVTYVAGDILNGGDRSVADVEINVEFLNVENQVVFHQTLRPMEPNPVAIPPGKAQTFRLAFDQLPDDWNENYPRIRITGLLLR